MLKKLVLDCIDLRNNRQGLQTLLLLAPSNALNSRIRTMGPNDHRAETKKAAKAEQAQIEGEKLDEATKKDLEKKAKRKAKRDEKKLEEILSKRTTGAPSTTSTTPAPVITTTTPSDTIPTPPISYDHPTPPVVSSMVDDGLQFSIQTPDTVLANGINKTTETAQKKRTRAPAGQAKKTRAKRGQEPATTATFPTNAPVTAPTSGQQPMTNFTDAFASASTTTQDPVVPSTNGFVFEEQHRVAPAIVPSATTLPASDREFTAAEGLAMLGTTNMPAAVDGPADFGDLFNNYHHIENEPAEQLTSASRHGLAILTMPRPSLCSISLPTTTSTRMATCSILRSSLAPGSFSL